MIEVLRSLEEEGVHFAWVSVSNEDDTWCTRGYHTETTFHGSTLHVHLVGEEAYLAALHTGGRNMAFPTYIYSASPPSI